MKKRLVMACAASAVMMAAFSFSSFADNISEVKFNAYIEDDTSMSAGEAIFPEFEIVDDDGTYDFSVTSEPDSVTTASSAKTSKSFTLEFTASGDNVFTSSTKVTATGVDSVTSTKVKDDGDTLQVKVKCYVYYMLAEPTVDDDSFIDDPTASKISFDKNGANTVEYYIVYNNSSGDSVTKHGTTTSTSISISSYTKDYDEDDEEDGYEDKAVRSFYIRAKSLSSSSNPYIAPSTWVKLGDEEPDGDVEDYETWGDFLGSTSSGSATSSATISYTDTSSDTSSTAAGPTSSSGSGGWAGSGTTWYYKNADGTNYVGWKEVNGEWYYMDPSNGGLMKAGWFLDSDGQWYYLNENQGSTYGAMLTGWQTINGVTYFLRQSTGTGGSKGAMVTGTVTIDGQTCTFDSSGALISRS